MDISATNARYPADLQWKPVWGFEGHYDVSNYGHIRSVSRYVTLANGNVRYTPSRTMQQMDTNKGYLQVQFYKDGGMLELGVHILVAECFIPNPGCKPQVNHIDGNKHNNVFRNLEWATATENMMHCVATGLHNALNEIVHCNELNLTALSVSEMVRFIRDTGKAKVTKVGIQGAMNRGIQHHGFTFKKLTLEEYKQRRQQCRSA